VSRLLEGSIELGLVGAKWNDRRILSEEIFSDELVLTVYPGILGPEERKFLCTS